MQGAGGYDWSWNLACTNVPAPAWGGQSAHCRDIDALAFTALVGFVYRRHGSQQVRRTARRQAGDASEARVAAVATMNPGACPLNWRLEH